MQAIEITCIAMDGAAARPRSGIAAAVEVIAPDLGS